MFKKTRPILFLFVGLLFSCTEAPTTSRVTVSLKECLDPLMGTPSSYMQCAQQHNLPTLDALRGCFVWQTEQNVGWSTLYFRDGWTIDPDQSGADQAPEGRITAAAFFITTEELSCNSLLPSTLCNALPNCLLKLTEGRQMEDNSEVITFRSESGVCAVDNQTPTGFQSCISTTALDQYTPGQDGGGIQVDGGDGRLNDATQPTCSDGVHNGDETDVDCGGECNPCDNGSTCRDPADCVSRNCRDCAEGDCPGSVCAAATCEDGEENGDETDVDCGGSCAPCGDGLRCNEASDCDAYVCSNDVGAGTCQPPRCDDGVKNGVEEGTDCGGECPACNACTHAADCAGDTVCINNLCSPPLANGQACGNDTHCGSNHCQNGLCCGSGVCCRSASDCPGSFSSGPRCDDTLTCQGSRVDAVCQAFRCGSESVGDDSGCNGQTANTCGAYPSVHCNGQRNQSAPQCATSCLNNNGCDAGLSCINGSCRSGAANGTACAQNTECESGHCRNGFCCTSGDCCATAVDCPGSYASASTCNDPSSCQGTRMDAVCQSNRCASVSAEDDSGCNGQVANTCGPYPSVNCSSQRTQSAPVCETTCVGNAECDAAFACISGSCQSVGADGSACTQDSQCASSHCQNGYCCLGGDCCQSANNCGDDYRLAPLCLDPEACQGRRGEPACNSNRCEMTVIEDDSGCTAASFSQNCFTYLDIACNGQVEQTPPQCATSCTNDSVCKEAFECINNLCTIDLGGL